MRDFSQATVGGGVMQAHSDSVGEDYRHDRCDYKTLHHARVTSYIYRDFIVDFFHF